MVGSSLYEWFSHNIVVSALIMGTVGAVGYFLYQSLTKKGRYRQ